MKNQLKQIGKGSFTKAFLNQDGECILHTIDPVKVAMAEDLFVPSHRMFPNMEILEHCFDDDYYVMKTNYLPRPKSIKKNVTPRQWRFYRALLDVYAVSRYRFSCHHKRTEGLYQAFKSMPNEFKAEKEALLEMVDGLRNYCEAVAFEISPRNVTVRSGKLVLLDCFFDPFALCKVRGC